MSEQSDRSGGTADAYDRVADEYVRRIYHELRDKPLDRELLERFAREVGTARPVCDLGCGPGHVARYLAEQGLTVCGFDLSREMTRRARQLNPEIAVLRGDMRSIGSPDGAWAGMTAFYSLIHISRPDLPDCLKEIRRVLAPGGRLLAAFHIGEGTTHMEEWWGHPVSIDFHHYGSDEMAGALRRSGLDVLEIIERDPYPDVEYQSRRSYVFARRPS